ncbi:MAG TPA: prolyl oligopeptidase family serine peptidase [Longimicrobium sp.]
MTFAKAIAAVTLAAAALLACGETPVEQDVDPVEQEDAAQLTLSADSIVVDMGDGSLLTAAIRDASGPVQYASRDQGVATVDANGAIRAVGVGSTYVVGTLSDRPSARDSVLVRVHPLVISGDPCPASRPEFGVATAAERALFAYDANAPLNLQKTAQSTTAAFALSTITYNSPAGGSVTGIMAEPVGRSGPRPGMVLLHASGATAQGMAPYAQRLAAHGAVVIAIDAPHVRRGGASGSLWTSQDRHEQIQLTRDLQRAVDVLIATGQVDPARIGFEGYSYGGILGVGFVGIEPRLKAAVLAAAMGGIVTGATMPGKLASLAARSCATRAAWFQAMIPIEPIRFISHNSTTALLFLAGRSDTAVLPADTQTLYDAATAPKELRWYDSGHLLPPQALLATHDWLHQQIGIDPRTGS